MAKQRQRKDDEDESDKETSSSEEEHEEEEESSEEDEAEEDEAEEDEAEGSGEDESDEDEDSDEDDDSEEEEEDRASEPPGEKVAADASESDDEAESKKDDDEEEEEEEEELLPANLGAQRYVYSAFFAATILGGYILGRAVETAWARLAISDWAVEKVPQLTAVTDDSKQTYSFLVGGLVAVLIAIRQFRKESVRKWSDDVTAELLKVKWPSRKEVYASTIVVLATSAVAVVYLFLLDRFWSFVTNLIYGSPT